MMDAQARKRWLLVAAGFGVGLFMLDAVVLRPLGGLWQRQGERITAASNELTRGDALVERLDATETRWKSMKDATLPRDTGKAEALVIGAIDAWADRSGFKVSNIRPAWVAIKSVGDRFEVRLSGDGDLQQVARFLFELEQDKLPLAVEETIIRSKDERGAEIQLEVRFSALRIGGSGA